MTATILIVLLIFAAALGYGRFLLKKIGADTSLLIGLDLGLWVVSLLVFLAGLAGWLHKGVLVAIVGSGIVLLIGAANCCKYTSLLLFFLLPLGMLVACQDEGKLSLRTLIGRITVPIRVGILIASPWWLRNIILVNNPAGSGAGTDCIMTSVETSISNSFPGKRCHNSKKIPIQSATCPQGAGFVMGIPLLLYG